MKRSIQVCGICSLALLLHVACSSGGSVIDPESVFNQQAVDEITADVLVPALQAVNLGLLGAPTPAAGFAGEGFAGFDCEDASHVCSSGTVQVCAVSPEVVEIDFTDCVSEYGGTTNGSIELDFTSPFTMTFAIDYDGLSLGGTVILEEEGTCLRYTLDDLQVVSAEFATTASASLLYCGSPWPQSGSLEHSITGAGLDYRFEVAFPGAGQADALISDLSSGNLLATCAIALATAQATCNPV